MYCTVKGRGEGEHVSLWHAHQKNCLQQTHWFAVFPSAPFQQANIIVSHGVAY